MSEEKAVLFRICGKAFAIGIAQVKEVCYYDKFLSQASSPKSLAGVARRYGGVIPVVNLADKLGLSATEPEENSALIVKMDGGQEIGIVVDEVTGIIHNPESAGFLDLRKLFSEAEILQFKNAG